MKKQEVAKKMGEGLSNKHSRNKDRSAMMKAYGIGQKKETSDERRSKWEKSNSKLLG